MTTAVTARRILAGATAALAAAWLLWPDLSTDSAEPATTPPFTPEREPPGQRPPTRPDLAANPITGQVSGEVLDAEGSPLASATVCAIVPLQPVSPAPHCATSNAAGEWQLELAPGLWQLGASASGWAPSHLGPGRRSNRLHIAAGQTRRLDFVLSEPGRVVRGVVRDSLGGVISGALVTVGAHPGITEPGALARSDDEGEFELTIAPRNTMVSAHAPGYFPGSAAVRTGVDVVELSLAPETLVRGRVVWDHDASAVALAEVFVHGSETHTMADDEGRFALAFDPSRENTVFAMAPAGHGSEVLAPSPAGEHRELELRLTPAADLVLALYLLQGAGAGLREPCAEGFVRLDGPPGDVLGFPPIVDGEVELRGLPAGRHSLRVACRGAIDQTHELELVAGLQRVELELEPAPLVRGRVLAHDGTPASRVQLVFAGEHPASDITTTTGEFVADYLPPGRYVVEARSVQLGQGALVEFELDERELELDITMQPWASLRGRVHDGEGKPVAGLALSLAEQAEARGRGTTSTREDGSFEIRALRSGALSLFAGGLRLARAGEPVEDDRVDIVHDEAQASELELVVEPRSRDLTLQIVDEEGLAIAGLRVGLVREATASELDYFAGSQTSDLDGVVHFVAVPDGELSLRWPDGTLVSIGSVRTIVLPTSKR
jgi:hypothetical protein